MQSMNITSDFGKILFKFEANSSIPIQESSTSSIMTFDKKNVLTLNFVDLENLKANMGKHIINVILTD